MSALPAAARPPRAPGPRGLIAILRTLMGFRRDPIGTLDGLFRVYGDVVDMRFGWRHFLCIVLVGFTGMCHPFAILLAIRDDITGS